MPTITEIVDWIDPDWRDHFVSVEDAGEYYLTQRGFADAIGVSDREVRYWCADRPVPRWVMICAWHLAECAQSTSALHPGDQP